MFDQLNYKSKLEICRLYYNTVYYIECIPDPKIYFSFKNVVFEHKAGRVTESREVIKIWYYSNLDMIRKYKLKKLKKAN